MYAVPFRRDNQTIAHEVCQSACTRGRRIRARDPYTENARCSKRGEINSTVDFSSVRTFAYVVCRIYRCVKHYAYTCTSGRSGYATRNVEYDIRERSNGTEIDCICRWCVLRAWCVRANSADLAHFQPAISPGCSKPCLPNTRQARRVPSATQEWATRARAMASACVRYL